VASLPETVLGASRGRSWKRHPRSAGNSAERKEAKHWQQREASRPLETVAWRKEKGCPVSKPWEFLIGAQVSINFVHAVVSRFCMHRRKPADDED